MTALPFATRYFQQLAALGEQIIASDRAGQVLDFPAGISRLAGQIQQRARQGGKIMFIGNGGSAAIASHQALDYWKSGGIPALAFNDSAMLTCLGNDYGFAEVFTRPIAMFAQPQDMVVAISSSGQSPNILAGVQTAVEKGCLVVTLSAFEPVNPLRRLGDLNFYVPTRSYGLAEISHLSICHCIIDGIMKGSLLEQERLSITESRG